MATDTTAHVPGKDYFRIGAKDATHLSSPIAPAAPRRTPLKRPRLALYLAALLLAVGTLIAQVVLMTHKYKGVAFFSFYSAYYEQLYVAEVSYSVKGKLFAKEPVLVIAVAAIACQFALSFFAILFFPVVSASLAGAIVEVVLVPLVGLLWLAAVGVSAKTANVMKDSGWPKAWVASNGAALGFECASVLVWTAITAISIIALVRVVKARKAACSASDVYNGANAA